MARINIEDELMEDGRWQDLLALAGDRFRAAGMLIDAWKVAQKFFLNTKTNRMIPLEEWKKRKCANEVIEVGLAEIIGDYVYVKGSKERFAWLLGTQQAGLASAAKRKMKQESEQGLTSASECSTSVDDTLTECAPPYSSLSSLSSESQSSNTHSSASQQPPLSKVLKPDRVIQLWDDELASKKVGRISYCKGLNRKQNIDFAETVKHKEFSTLEDWKNLFLMVAKSPFLRGEVKGKSFIVTLGWLVNFDNAKDVENGKYPGEYEESKGNSREVTW